MNPQGLLGQLNQSMSQGVPEIAQVSSTSPNFDPSLQPAPPSPMPNKSPITDMGALQRSLQAKGIQMPQAAQSPQGAPQGGPQVTLPVQDENPQQPGTQVSQSEAQLILKALSSRLGMIGKHESAIRDHIFPAPQVSQG